MCSGLGEKDIALWELQESLPHSLYPKSSVCSRRSLNCVCMVSEWKSEGNLRDSLCSSIMWVLETELGSLGLALSIFSCWAILLAPFSIDKDGWLQQKAPELLPFLSEPEFIIPRAFNIHSPLVRLRPWGCRDQSSSLGECITTLSPFDLWKQSTKYLFLLRPLGVQGVYTYILGPI